MPELHINGRSKYHNFFLEMSYVETSNANSPTLLVTERSRNSTTILSNTTNTVIPKIHTVELFSLLPAFALLWS